MRRISDLPLEEAAAELRACCASARWVERMLSQRPFKDANEVFESAERIWWDITPAQREEAFAAHPRIGERRDARSAGEQAGALAAPDDMKQRLAEVNAAYEARFGRIYLVCASGKSADELLRIAEQRLHNEPEAELRIAAEEQAKITKLRLVTLLDKGT